MRRLIVNRGDDCSTKKDYSWFMAIEKHAVITEVGGFGDPQFDKTRCLQINKKLLYLLNHGEAFTQSEAAALLSSAVNLYRFQDVHLRRMFHLIARDLCPIANEVPLVTSLLLKDVDTDNVAYRANVIRLLCQITNDTSLSQVLKCLKEARCDGNPMVENASFVCAINMLKRDPRMAIKLEQVYPRPTDFRTGKHIQFHSIYLDYVLVHDASSLGSVRWIYMLHELADGTSTSSRVHYHESGLC
ncbi:coatomer subunit gamma-like isoform X2 [Salvia hispanica]|uniref:coatomer subunit gamma-like isoform X2 n=1 Tax=Salvia hispanica TaxID=49212 RepID=UPI0020091A73|nr:coatomer subunit gamma-like isoform X2 [Salvia hispanica]